MRNLSTLRRFLFGLPLTEAEFAVRGFEKGSQAQSRLELVAKTVVQGYNVALENGLTQDLHIQISLIQNELVGFFNEGVGMGLYTLDLFFGSGKKRFQRFIQGPGKNHAYMSYIGAGIASAIFKNNRYKDFIQTAPSEACALVLNGIGFYNAYFKPKKTFGKLFLPASVRGKDSYYIECYDNGVGRAVWFYTGGNPYSIASTIGLFPKDRQGAIWAGVGLAATYAGGVPEEKIYLLRELSGDFAIRLGEGSVLATHTRHLAGNPHLTDTTEQILTGHRSIECHELANSLIQQIDGKLYAKDQRPSFQVFLEDIRKWLSLPAPEICSEKGPSVFRKLVVSA